MIPTSPRSEVDSPHASWTPHCDRRGAGVPLPADTAVRAGPEGLHTGHRPRSRPVSRHDQVTPTPQSRQQTLVAETSTLMGVSCAFVCRLKKLSLSNTQVTDTGLPSLRGLQELQELCLDRTAVTSRGVAELITCLPQLQVIYLIILVELQRLTWILLVFGIIVVLKVVLTNI